MKLFKVIQTSFDNFDYNVKNYLNKVLGAIGLNYTHNQIFGIIFDGVKGIMQNTMFYIEDAFTELNIFTASRKKSILSLAKISGYEGYYGTAANGLISLEYTNSNSLNINVIYIENNSYVINNTTGIKYMLDLPTDNFVININKPIIQNQFKIIEGYFAYALFTSSALKLETLNVNTVSLFDTNYIYVYVNGLLWEQVSNLYEMTENSNTYIVTIGYNNSFDIMFGNGTYGKVPENGSSVLVKYLCHNGTLGNIDNNIGYSFSFYSKGYDKNGNSLNLNDYFNIYSNAFITGGTDADSIKKIRSMVGYNSRSLVLANEDNFRLFIKRFSFVGNSNIWVNKNSMTVNCSILLNTSKVSYDNYLNLNDKDLILSSLQKQMIYNVLENSNKTFTGVNVNFIDPVIRRYAIICYLKIDNLYNKESIKTVIQNVIVNYFIGLEHNTIFISKTDIIKAITNNVDGIQYIDISIISDLAEKTFNIGYYYKIDDLNNQEKVMYEPNSYPGLDKYGNILLNSKLEMPILSNGILYFFDKTDRKQSIRIDAISYYFI